LLANFSGHKDIAQAVHDIAYRYRCANKQDKANQIDQYVVDNWPGSDYAVLAQMDLAKSYVNLGETKAADAAFDTLLTNFSGNALIARAVHDIAQQYRGTRKYEKANQLYQYVIDNWPKAEHALWSQADLIKSYLALADDPNAQEAVDKLLTNFNDNPFVARAIHDTAWEYRKLGNYGRANELDQYVIDHWSADVQVMWAKMDMAKTDIWLGNYAAAEKTIDILIADFNDQPELATAIFMLGEQYYNKAFQFENESREAEAKEHFRKAIAIWERIINELPRSSMTPQAYYFSAECYHRLAQYEKAIGYYEKIVALWPDYEYAWNAQFMVACCLEHLVQAKEVPLAEGTEKIRQACLKVLNNYPNCVASGPAKGMLSRWEKVKTIE